MLNEAATRAMRATALPGVMDELLTTASTLTGAEAAVLELWEETNHTHRHLAHSGLTQAAVSALVAGFAACKQARWATRTLVLDVDDRGVDHPPLRDAALRTGLRSLRVRYLAGVHGRPLGWLGLGMRHPRNGEPRRIRLLHVHLDQVSGLIEQMLGSARALREAQASLHHLRRATGT